MVLWGDRFRAELTEWEVGMSAQWRRIGVVAVATFSVALLSQAGAMAAKGGGGGGGGGHTETAGNNLSFPVIWGDLGGPGLTLPGTELQASLTVPWIGVPIEGECPSAMVPYAQKTLGNVWQAENQTAGDLLVEGKLFVDEVDWGDSLESVDMKVGRPVRVELSLYKTELLDAMTGYSMVMLANPSSPDEVQGVCAPNPDTKPSSINSYESTEATVYSPTAGLVIQKIDPTATLTWTGASWEGGGTPVALTFAGELNVGGKVIYGLSQGGWKPTQTGTYRITFFFPTSSDQQTGFDTDTIIRLAVEAEEAVSIQAEGEAGGDAVVDAAHNLTYIDVTVIGGGGGGGKPAR